jgi:hypothetical protein
MSLRLLVIQVLLYLKLLQPLLFFLAVIEERKEVRTKGKRVDQKYETKSFFWAYEESQTKGTIRKKRRNIASCWGCRDANNSV